MPGQTAAYATMLDDGSEPTDLGDRITQLLANHGYRKAGVDWWTHPATGITMTLGYSSRAYRLRYFPAGQRVGPPAEVVEICKLDHLDRAATLLGWLDPR